MPTFGNPKILPGVFVCENKSLYLTPVPTEIGLPPLFETVEVAGMPSEN